MNVFLKVYTIKGDLESKGLQKDWISELVKQAQEACIEAKWLFKWSGSIITPPLILSYYGASGARLTVNKVGYNTTSMATSLVSPKICLFPKF